MTGEETNNTYIGFKYPKVIWIAILSFGVYYAIAVTGLKNGKLFVQDELLKFFSEDSTSLILGTVLLASRITRIVSNTIFFRVLAKMKDRIGVILSTLLCMSFVLMLIGYTLNVNVPLKFIVIGFGYILVLFVIDPYKLYTHILILNKIDKDKQPKILMLLEISSKLLSTLINFIMSSLLITYPPIFIVTAYIVLGSFQIGIAGYLFRLIKIQNT